VTSRSATKDALLTYIRADPEPRPLVQIKRYLWQMHHVTHAATRQALSVLCKAGVLERVEGHCYRIAPARASLNKPAPTTHNTE
jgi:hypothetical protein